MGWPALAVFALVVWSLQRLVTKVALLKWSTARFYRWNAIVSLLVYIPFAVAVPPDPSQLLGAVALSLLMAITFWVTTEATRRGPLGAVAPLTAVSPALTATLAVIALGERPGLLGTLGIAAAVAAALLLAGRPAQTGLGPWLGLAVAALVLQGVGAFLAKIIVSEGGPTTLLVPSVIVQLIVGLFIARAEPIHLAEHLHGRPLAVTLTLAAAAVATVGYLSALEIGPASVIVPLVATSPMLGGLLGIVVLKERTRPRQRAGIAVGLLAVVLLASQT